MSPQSTEVGGVGGVVNRDGSVSTMRTGKSNKTQVRGGGGGGRCAETPDLSMVAAIMRLKAHIPTPKPQDNDASVL